MSKTVKKIIIIAVALVLIAGTVFATLTFLRSAKRNPVPVFSLDQIGMTDYYGDQTETEATVSESGIQRIAMSQTQTVKEIFVTEGQKVAVGDPILSFDSTLTEIEVKRAELRVQQLELDLKSAQKELAKINSLKPHTSTLVVPDNTVTYEPHDTPFLIRGTGTIDDPYCFLWQQDDTLDAETIASMLPEYANEGDGESSSSEYEDEVYVVLIERENNALNAPITGSWGLILINSDDGISLRICDPMIPEDLQEYEEIPEPYYKEGGSEYTAAEIAQMRVDAQKEIESTTLELRTARVEYKQKAAEAGDSVIRAKIDGTVTSVRDPALEYGYDKPLVEISAGGGYTVIGNIGELALDSISIGQTVSITAYTENDDTVYCEGVVRGIGDKPSTDYYGYYDGNPNVSYYPFTVEVSADYDLTGVYYVTVSYDNSAASTENAPYVMNAFIRAENGRNYVWVRGTDGKLEKRAVVLGNDLWGEMTQIKSGIGADDLIAFPYGSDVFEGAKTRVATEEDMMKMYNY